MSGVIQGFGVIGAIVLVGYVLGRSEVLGDSGRDVLAKISFYVGTPALLLTMLADSDVRVLFSAPLLVTALSTFAAAALFVLIALWRRWNIRRTTIGALCSSYVNAGNLGIPVAVYVLGDASLVAPVMLFQLLVMTPIGLTVIDFAQSGEKDSTWTRLLAPFKNPIVICSLLGVGLSLLGWRIPGPVAEPLTLLGHLSVPTVLLAFGISLRGSQLPAGGAERWPVLVSVGLKSFAHPVIAWAIGAGLFGMSGAALFAVVVISALPAAQNLFVYASRYNVGVRLARESILLSTILSVPVLVTVTALLG
ncbi:AEC family transporter [Saccharopolyspora sp. TS4A08]|uniref:AEC family transporter n=1 Tax=Saccharopolyspora ipomoeae TaxID=3042027 RepID=A0ABT6PJH3_9PSEU|nr:AEC family transporter [Saccharopolyspora sp. TS4A08]MDI2028137.1 AEC family transporter [Saccharopolyspora sp. TS4A08]